MEKSENLVTNMNTLNNNKHQIYLKDKYGIHFLQPFIDKNTKLLSVENSSVINNSGNLTAVKNSIKF
jgi:hypothetical protein